MNKTEEILEKIDLLETNPFHGVGYSIDTHVYLSPKEQEEILHSDNKVFGPKRHILKTENRRVITVHSYKGEHYGTVEHTGPHGHPIDKHFYKLKKRKKKKK